jgi:hypothetical protein
MMRKATLNLATLNALTICQSLDSAAEALTMADRSNWAAWMRYFLQALEYKAADCERYEASLESLGRDIAARLNEGRW